MRTGSAYEGTWHDGKTGRLWGQINGTALIWWDGIRSELIIDGPNIFRLPLKNVTLTGTVVGQDMIHWSDGSTWMLSRCQRIYLGYNHMEL